MLQLDKEHGMILGVCAGLSNTTGIDVGLVRFAFVVFVLLGGSGILLYLILWLIMYFNGKQ